MYETLKENFQDTRKDPQMSVDKMKAERPCGISNWILKDCAEQ